MAAKLGQILIAAGVITEEHLKEALALQKKAVEGSAQILLN